MELYQIIALGLLAAVLSMVLRGTRPEYSLFIALAACTVIIGAVFIQLEQVTQTVTAMMDAAQMPTQFAQILFKALGICLITQLAADTCRDAGESAIATKIETAGKLAILITGLPLFTQLLEIVSSLIYL